MTQKIIAKGQAMIGMEVRVKLLHIIVVVGMAAGGQLAAFMNWSGKIEAITQHLAETTKRNAADIEVGKIKHANLELAIAKIETTRFEKHDGDVLRADLEKTKSDVAVTKNDIANIKAVQLEIKGTTAEILRLIRTNAP